MHPLSAYLTYIVFSIYTNISSSLSLVTGFYRNRYITYTYNEEKKGERNPRQHKYITIELKQFILGP